MEKWSKQALSLAKAKHREVTNGKGLSDMDLRVLEGMQSRITASWSEQSESGQAAVIVIGLCAEYYYECLASGYDIRASSDILQGSIAQATDDMVEARKSKRRRKAKLQLSKLLAKLKSMQLKWREDAQSRY